MKTLADEVRGVPLGEIRGILERSRIAVEAEPEAVRFQGDCGPVEIRVIAPGEESLDQVPLKAVVVVRTKLSGGSREDDPTLFARLNRGAGLGALTDVNGEPWVISRLTTYECEMAWPLEKYILVWAAISGANALFRVGAVKADTLPDGTADDRPAWPAADFAKLVERYRGRFFCSSGEHGFTVEFALRGGAGASALGDDCTALLTMNCLDRHPVLGPGLHVQLELPHRFQDPGRLARLLGELNTWEAFPGDRVPHYGAWCPGRVRNPAYTSYFPRLLWREGFATNLVTWMLARARMADAFLVMRGVTAGEN